MTWKEEIREHFSHDVAAHKWDKMYDRETQNLDDVNFRLRRDFTVKYITDKYESTANIFDLGCGSGPVTYELLKRGYRIVGLDYSVDMLRNAKRRLTSGGLAGSPLINGNGETLPFRDEAFDCVVCLGVISYVENYESLIRETHRVLKPGGTLLISFRNKHNLIANDPVALLKHAIKKVAALARGPTPEPFSIGHYMLRREVIGNVQAHGFDYAAFKGIGFGPYSVYNRKIFSGPTAIRVSRWITNVAEMSRARFVFELASDVNIVIFRKSALHA